MKREVDCLLRLQELTAQLEDIIIFLKQEGLVDDNAIRHIKASSDKAKDIRSLLNDLKIKQKLQLLQYEWSVLPAENIIITIITDRNQKEFSFNGG
jgi:aryl-alcohol dehydrogenase-like predicted oxidoreductase